MLFKVEQTNEIKGIRLARDSPPISCLLFADDLMLFIQASEKNIVNRSNIL